MTDSNETPFVRLPVREMRDEPAPERAAQEGDLPPLPEPDYPAGTTGMLGESTYTADQMREYARLALAAAGGGVPQRLEVDECTVYAVNSAGTNLWWATVSPGHDDNGRRISDEECRRIAEALASSPQPEAAPAVAQVPKVSNARPVLYGDEYGLAAAPAAPAQPEQQGSSEREGWGKPSSLLAMMVAKIKRGELPVNDIGPMLVGIASQVLELESAQPPERAALKPLTGEAFLCRAWGESDLPVAELVTDWDGVRRFMVREWLGDEDATTYDGTNQLDQLKADFDEHEADGTTLSYSFEIGGVSVERVFAHGILPQQGEG